MSTHLLRATAMTFRQSPARPLLMATIILLAACSGKSGSSTNSRSDVARQAATPFRPTATIRELMDSTVDPAADGVWNSVSTVVDDKGVTENRPRTPEEWQAVRRHAMTLVEAMNLVMMEGRHAAPKGTKAGLGELDPVEIDRRIAANRDEFNSFAQAVHDEGMKAIDAIDRKDPNMLSRVGGDLDERCESCHITFWYPNSPRPKS